MAGPKPTIEEILNSCNNKPRTPVVVDGKKVYILALVHLPEYYENVAEPDNLNEMELQDDVQQLMVLNISYDSKHLPTMLDYCRRDPQRYDKARVCSQCPRKFTNLYSYLLHIKLKHIDKPKHCDAQTPRKIGEEITMEDGTL